MALSILEPLSEEERRKVLVQAIRNPQTYEEVFREFGGKIPADSVLRSIAIRRFGFSGGGADRFVTTLRDSLDYLRSEGISDLAGEKVDSVPNEMESVAERAPRRSDVRASDVRVIELDSNSSADERLEFRLSPSSRAVVLFQGAVTREAIEKLSALLGMLKDTYPGDEGDVF